MIAQTIVAEVGLDMPSGQRKRISPRGWGYVRNKITGGKVSSPRHPPRGEPSGHGLPDGGHEFVAQQDVPGREIQTAALHLGAPKAITAMAHTLARLVYRMLKYGQDYVDKGMEFYQQRYQHQQIGGSRRRPKN